MLKSLPSHKNNGTILQIVLIIFMILVLNINAFCLNIVENSRGIARSKALNESRLIELTIIRYFKEAIQNDILFSDEITVEDYQIHYLVDDMGSYYTIMTDVTHLESTYSFDLNIDLASLNITSFTYK